MLIYKLKLNDFFISLFIEIICVGSEQGYNPFWVLTTEEAGDNIAEICHYGQRRFVSLGQTNGTLESIHFYATKIENEYTIQ